MTDQDMADMMRQLGLNGMLKMPADPDPGETQVNNSENVN